MRVEDTAELTVKQLAEWYIRRWEKWIGRPWPQAGRKRIRLPDDPTEDDDVRE